MDFVSWCRLLLDKLIGAADASSAGRTYGVNKARPGLVDAHRQLKTLGLLEEVQARTGGKCRGSPRHFWQMRLRFGMRCATPP
jgi:hypothetical protein